VLRRCSSLKPKVVAAGLILFLIGLYAGVINPSATIALSNSLGFTYTSYKEEPLLPLTLISINARDIVKVDINLRSNPDRASVLISFEADGPLNFYLMDEDGLKAWESGNIARGGVYAAAIAQTKYNQTIELEKAGRYYAVFDNTQESRRSVVLEVSEKVLTYQVSPQMEVLPQITLLIGFILILIGLKLRGKKKPT
jgi:uncharacterized membrane protein YiaA